MNLQGKDVVVTGASSGIGAAITREMAVRGARVTLVSRRREALETVASEIGPGARVEPCDLSRLEDVKAFAGRLLADGEPPDVLVNNAGAGRWLAVDETPPGEAAQMMAVPYLAAFELTRVLLPAMIERRSGRVVCMTSLAAWMHIPGAAGYSVARWAMRAFASQLREDAAWDRCRGHADRAVRGGVALLGAQPGCARTRPASLRPVRPRSRARGRGSRNSRRGGARSRPADRAAPGRSRHQANAQARARLAGPPHGLAACQVDVRRSSCSDAQRRTRRVIRLPPEWV